MQRIHHLILGLLAVVIFGTLFVLCSHRAAHAEGAPGNPFADWRPCKDWSVQDTLLQAAGTALIAVDWAQTRKLIALDGKPDKQGFVHEETNERLGKHPKPQTINAYFIGTGLGHLAASCLLPSPWRGHWQSVIFGLELNQVWSNQRVGLEFKISF